MSDFSKCKIQLRRGTAGTLSAANPVLGVGEPAFETDTNVLKVGDGVTSYNSLSSIGGGGGGVTNAVVSNTAGIPNSTRVTNIVSMSQSDYDNLEVYDNNTLYFLT